MRNLSPDFCTVPSTTAPTPSCVPRSRMSMSAARARNDAVLDATRKPSSLDNAPINSSAIPSHRYPWSRPGLMSANGSTATDGQLASSKRSRSVPVSAASNAPMRRKQALTCSEKDAASIGLRTQSSAPSSIKPGSISLFSAGTSIRTGKARVVDDDFSRARTWRPSFPAISRSISTRA